MGLNNDSLGSAIVLDIETFSLADAAEFMEEPTAPGNYKDPEKIAAYIEQKRVENLSRCALDPDLCCVVALGVQAADCPVSVVIAKDAAAEADMLRWFWNNVGHADTFIGYNLLSFDLPVLIRRSQYLGVPARHVNIDRYRTPHVDLMERLSFNGKLKTRSLDFYCRRFGIDVPGEHDGSEIDALVKAGDWQAVEDHCRADVVKTRRLAERLGHIQVAA